MLNSHENECQRLDQISVRLVRLNGNLINWNSSCSEWEDAHHCMICQVTSRLGSQGCSSEMNVPIITQQNGR